jgi:hypothetical protein
MTATRVAVRSAVREWARGQRQTLDALRRALEIVAPHHEGATSLDELIVHLMTGIAERHLSDVAGSLARLDDALLRLLEDVAALGQTLMETRQPVVREVDLRALADLDVHIARLEDRVVHEIDAQPQDLQDRMWAALEASRTPPPAVAETTGISTIDESRRRGEEALRWGQEVIDAYTEGRTLERTVAPVPVAHHPELTARLQRLQRAMRAYRAAQHTSPAAAQRAEEQLRTWVSEADGILRSWGRRFETTTIETHVPIRPDPAAPAESIDARTLAVRRTVTATPGLATASAADLFHALAVDEPMVRGTGVLSEPLARNLPGVGLEAHTPSPQQVRTWVTDPPWLASRLADLLTFAGHVWERAHLIGPGFGGELFEGLMLAPRGVNQVAQNRGIEAFLRHAADVLDADVHVTVEVHGRRLAVPLADGTFEHLDIMESVHYRVPAGARAIEGVHEHHLMFDIWVDADGTWRLSHNLPEGALDASLPPGGRG